MIKKKNLIHFINQKDLIGNFITSQQWFDSFLIKRISMCVLICNFFYHRHKKFNIFLIKTSVNTQG